jgi:hypothetical protein
MVTAWITTSTGYYLINLNMKYVGGDIYTNTIANVLSEEVATIVAAAIYQSIGTKISFIFSFLTSAIS